LQIFNKKSQTNRLTILEKDIKYYIIQKSSHFFAFYLHFEYNVVYTTIYKDIVNNARKYTELFTIRS
jgi:hypothetical protein